MSKCNHWNTPIKGINKKGAACLYECPENTDSYCNIITKKEPTTMTDTKALELACKHIEESTSKLGGCCICLLGPCCPDKEWDCYKALLSYFRKRARRANK